MDNSQRSLKVFLCHAHADQEQVHALYFRLIKDGVDAWLDKVKIVPGQDWEYEIRKAVRETDVVIVCLSQQFNKSGYRQKEVQIALDTAMKQPAGKIFIIPARLEECDNLEALEKWQWVDLFKPDGYERLMLALRIRASEIGITLQIKKYSLQRALQLSRTEISSERTKAEATSQVPNVNISRDRSKKSIPGKPGIMMSIVLIIFVSTLIAGLLNLPLIKDLFTSVNVVFTPTYGPTSTQDVTSNNTTATSTSEITPSPTSSVAISKGADNMPLVLIPAGEFLMGSKGNDSDERPIHSIYLNDYFIDQTEVTNAMYGACVQNGKCKAPRNNTSSTRHPGSNSFYYGNSEYDNYPVIHVSWDDAKAYCKFVGRRLPTEAEWEKAASWDDAKDLKRIYPWGNSIECSYANYYGGENRTLCVGDTTLVGSYPNGASFYGVLDMAGNVAEWVLDRYDPEYYVNSPHTNPSGPLSGDYIVVRGGSFLVGGDNNIRSSDRHKETPDFASHQIGFRCAVDGP